MRPALAQRFVFAGYGAANQLTSPGMHDILTGLSGVLGLPFGEGTMTYQVRGDEHPQWMHWSRKEHHDAILQLLYLVVLFYYIENIFCIVLGE